uniref:ATPase components of ABC transporters with duplicated ATPase domains n=1 Tax=Magnetospirillum gryphiswaldense TaxID=55518 RepID=A4U3I9_9PROT|nr:ATPase components of ABC transporters with duplicated ATPase domains [Magnetospirillum gryphiswaldense MSR-1]
MIKAATPGVGTPGVCAWCSSPASTSFAPPPKARAQTAPLRKKVQDAEKRLEKLGGDKAKIEAKLADPKLYSGPGEAVAKLQKDLAELDRAIANTESEWLELHEQLEAATANA